MILGLLVSSPSAVIKLKYGITFGPVWNWSFGPEGNVFSYGVNASYWDFRNDIPWSINLGYEGTDNDENLLYSEIQTGAVLAGVSTGLVYKMQRGFEKNRSGFGFQAAMWGNFIAGGNLRIRYLEGVHLMTGAYLTFPVVKTDGNFE